MVDPAASEFFEQQRALEPANGRCADSGVEGAEWASISHGIYLSIGASGIHRSLGVKVSYVQSTTMDSWKPLHLKMMELGGNARFASFLEEQGIAKDMPPRQKYRTRAAAWYRQNLKALAEGSPPLEPLASGEGCLPDEEFADEGPNILDQVFAGFPTDSLSMTAGGVPLKAVRQGCKGSSRSARKPSGFYHLHQHHPQQHTAPHQSNHVLHPSNPLHQHRLPHAGHPHPQPFAHEHPKSRKAKSSNRGSSDSLLLPSWVTKTFKNVTTAKGVRVAEKLKKMSTGKMAGFGPEASDSATPASTIAIGPGRMIGFGPETAVILSSSRSNLDLNSNSCSSSSSRPVAAVQGSAPDSKATAPEEEPETKGRAREEEACQSLHTKGQQQEQRRQQHESGSAGPPSPSRPTSNSNQSTPASLHSSLGSPEAVEKQSQPQQQLQQQTIEPMPTPTLQAEAAEEGADQREEANRNNEGNQPETSRKVQLTGRQVEEELEIQSVTTDREQLPSSQPKATPKNHGETKESSKQEEQQRQEKEEASADIDFRSDSWDHSIGSIDQGENACQAGVELLKCAGFESPHDQSETTDGLRDEESDLIMDEH